MKVSTQRKTKRNYKKYNYKDLHNIGLTESIEKKKENNRTILYGVILNERFDGKLEHVYCLFRST